MFKTKQGKKTIFDCTKDSNGKPIDKKVKQSEKSKEIKNEISRN